MDLSLNLKYAEGFKDKPHKTQALTENWIKDNMYCPRCGADLLSKAKNNAPVLDFTCPLCHQGFELKSTSKKFNSKIIAANYNTMLERIKSDTNPDFFFLNYRDIDYTVTNLFFVPKQFITPSVIEEREPLSENAKQAGWKGCYILLNRIPTDGIVYIVKDRVIAKKEDVISKLRRTTFLKDFNWSKRKWVVDVMRCLDKINADEFNLSDVYEFEDELHALYPNNNHVQDKIRQELQELRDMGYIEFCGRGNYRKITRP